MLYDLIIIGSGAAGLSAAIYAGRYRMKVLVIGEEFGGETATGGPVENYPGFKIVDGYELMNLMKEQAEDLESEVIDGKVTKIDRDGHCFEVHTEGKSFSAKTIILAVGSKRRHLNMANEKELTGRGVHYCVTCDAPVYNGKTIAIVGGGDASVKGVNLASEYVKKIFFIIRGKEVKAEPINYEQMKKLGDKVEVLLETKVEELVGKERLEKVILSKPYKGSKELVLDALFIEIGAEPNVELAKPLGVELSDRDYIKVDQMMKTNIDGVFAAGDAVNFFSHFKQDITAAAMGALAATSAYEDYKIHGDLCQLHKRPPVEHEV